VALTQPKGKTKPVEVFTVIDARSTNTAEPAWLAAYEDGVRHFRAREFEAAIPCFQAALSENPGDWLCESYYLEQCRAFAAAPPPADWTPVDVMTSK
jgi:adenylate cyclase